MEREDGMKHAVILLEEPGQAWHKHATLVSIGKRLAKLKGCPLIEDPPGDHWADRAGNYYLPASTLSLDSLPGDGPGWTPADLFGGVVPHTFMASKIITHPLLGLGASGPDGWSHVFPQKVGDVALRGFAVFSRADLVAAGERLLRFGPIRVKAGQADGGKGQYEFTDARDLASWAGEISEQAFEEGFVLEENLAEARTFSVGQIILDGTMLTYIGKQRATLDKRGRETYGGTTLYAVQGDWDALISRTTTALSREIIAAARLYDDCAANILGIVASRRNYDVIVGQDAAGRRRVAVLEQSWRTGGATPAEMLALETFVQEADVVAVRASSHEVFGAVGTGDPSHRIFCSGVDPVEGPITKYAKLEVKYHAQQQD